MRKPEPERKDIKGPVHVGGGWTNSNDSQPQPEPQPEPAKEEGDE